MRYRAPVLSVDDVEKIVERYVGGESIRSIAKSFGVTFQNIAYHLHKCGVALRKRGRTAP